jgi:undecaprenyl-diphosphatase
MRKVVSWLGTLDLVVIVTVLGMLSGVWIFIAVAYGVGAGSTEYFDETLLRSLRHADDLKRPVGPEWLPEIGRDLTAIGGVAALCLVTAAVAGYLLI